MVTRKEEVNGEHGIIIKLIESLHKENKDEIKNIFSKIDHLTDMFYKFRLNLPCKVHARQFDEMEKQVSGRTQWRMAVVGCILGMLGLTANALVQWGDMKASNRFMKESIDKIELKFDQIEHIGGHDARH